MSDLPLSGPEALEQEEYYYGLKSKPRLIARTSTTSWPPPRPPSEAHGAHYDLATSWTKGALIKRLCPIGSGSDGHWGTEDPKAEGQHPILSAWSPTLRDALVSALAESPLRDVWTAFFPIRITAQWFRAAPGHDSITSAVVLLLCVAPDSSITWTMGLSAAQSCRLVLQAHGVPGTEVEVCTAVVLPLADEEPNTAASRTPASTPASPINLDNFENTLYGAMDMPSLVKKTLALFHSRPGQLLERMEGGPGRHLISVATGTLGFYLGLADNIEHQNPPSHKAPVFAITSRHVAVGRLVPHDKAWTHDGAAACETQPIHIRWGTQRDLELAASTINQAGNNARDRAYYAMKRFADDEAEQNAAVCKLAFAEEYVPRVVNTMRDIAGASDNLLRSIGHVAYAAPHRRTARGAWSDWALVELNDATAETVRRRRDQNSVYVPKTVLDQFEDTTVRNGLMNDSSLFKPNLSSILSFHYTPSSNATIAASQRPRWMMKRGARTGVTVGVASEIEAVFRVSLDDGHYRVAFSLIVLDFAGDNDTGYFSHFSGKGDSGAAIFDADGQLVGMIDAGVGNKEPPLLRHFQKPGGDVELPQSIASQDAAAAAAAATTDPPQGFSPLDTTAVLGIPRQTNERVDVTLVTPIDWLLEDIGIITGKVPYVL